MVDARPAARAARHGVDRRGARRRHLRRAHGHQRLPVGRGLGRRGRGLHGGDADRARLLRHHRAHFPGEEGTWLRAYGHGGTWQEGYAALTAALGLDGAAPGDAVAAGAGAPALAGTVAAAETGAWQGHVILRTEAPAPGLARVSAWGDAGTLSVQLCLYGDAGALAAVRELPAWEAWMRARFPAAG